MIGPPRDRSSEPRRISRRRLLTQLGGLGALALGAVTTGCGPVHLPSPGSLVQGVLGQAQQATGAAPPPKVLHWITPIPPPLESLAASPSGPDQITAQGWLRVLDPWKRAHPDVTLSHDQVAPADLTNQQIATAKSGDPADVAYTDWGRMLGEAGIVDPLDLGELARQIVPVALTPHEYGVQVYALPIYLTCLGLYVSHARFQSAELDPRSVLRDWSSFETAAQKLTDRAHRRYGVDVFGSGSPRSGQVRYAPFLWTAGGSFFDDTATRATWNEAAGLEAIRYLARVAQNYAAPGAATGPDETLVQNWLTGQTAMLLAGPELTARIDPATLPFSVQSVPAYIQGQASSLAMSAGATAIFAGSKHKDWALDFARYLAGKDAQISGLAFLPLMPANGDASDAPVFQGNAAMGQFLRILHEDDVHSFPLAASHNAEIQQIFRAYLGVALQGLSTPDAAWNKSAADATALLAAPPTPTPG